MSLLAGTGFLFSKLAQATEVACPHLSQHGLEGAEPAAVRFVIPVGPLAPLDDQSGILEQAKALRDRRPAHLMDGCGNVAGGSLGIPDQAEDLAPSRIGDRAHRGFAGQRRVPVCGLPSPPPFIKPTL